MAVCDKGQEPGIRLSRASLTQHPAARASALQDIEPTEGAGAIKNVETLFTRIDALAGTPDGDAALKTLAIRGLDEAMRPELAEAVRVARKGTTV